MAVDDTHTIRRLKHEYCFAIDAGNYEEWAAMFTEKGCFIRDNGFTYEGVEELYEFASEIFDAAVNRVAHIVTILLSMLMVTKRLGSGTSFCCFRISMVTSVGDKRSTTIGIGKLMQSGRLSSRRSSTAFAPMGDGSLRFAFFSEQLVDTNWMLVDSDRTDRLSTGPEL